MSESSKRLLSMLLVVGAQAPDRGLRVEELAQKLGADLSMVQAELRQLVGAGYVALSGPQGDESYYLTGTGVITASSTYS